MSEITIEVTSRLEWRATRCSETQYWVAECAPLGLVMEAPSLDELDGLIEEASYLLFSTLLQDGQFDNFLRARGWQASNVPENPEDDKIGFSIPWSLVAERSNVGSKRRGLYT